MDKQVEESDYHNEVIQEIFSLIKKDGINPTEYARMKDEYSDEEYMPEQTQKARNEGMEKGREAGRQEGVLIMAKNMKEAKVAMNLISEVTCLPVEQIEGL